MSEVLVFIFSLGAIIGFAAGSIIVIVFNTSQSRKNNSQFSNPRILDWIVIIFFAGASILLNMQFTEIFIKGLDDESFSIKESEEIYKSLYWLKFLSYMFFLPLSCFFAYTIEAKATNRFVFKGFILGITNFFFYLIGCAVLCYQIAIEISSSNLMNYGSLFLSTSAVVITLFIAALQVKDTV